MHSAPTSVRFPTETSAAIACLEEAASFSREVSKLAVTLHRSLHTELLTAGSALASYQAILLIWLQAIDTCTCFPSA